MLQSINKEAYSASVSVKRISFSGLLILIYLAIPIAIFIGYEAFADTTCTSWQEVASLQKPRTSFAGGVINGKIYVFGGGNSIANTAEKTLERYDPSTGNWSFLASNEHNGGQGVEEVSGAVLNNKLYVFGGDTGLPPTGNINEVYDPGTNQWTTLAAKPTTVKHAMVTTYNGEIYLFGGDYEVDENSPQVKRNVVEAYNPGTNTWRHVTDMPGNILASVIATVGNRAYIIGGGKETAGYEPTGRGPYDALQKVYAYDFQTDTWITNGLGTLDRAMVWPSASSATTVVDGKIYLVGGLITLDPNKWEKFYDFDMIPTSRVMIYETGTHQFSEAQSLPYYLFGHLTLRVNEDVYVVGGQTIWEDSRDTVFKVGCSSCDQSIPQIMFPDQNAVANTSSVTFQWNSTGKSFPIEIQAIDGASIYTGTVTSSQEKTIPALPDGAYRWRVAASNDACTSNWSSWIPFYVEFDPPDGVVAYYPMDNDPNDYSGNELHGTPQGGVTGTDGIAGGAGLFNGTDAYVTLPESYYTGDNYTYSMWVRPNNLSDTIRTIFGVQDTFAIRYQNSTIRLHSDTVQKDVADILAENVWTQLVFVYRKNVDNGSIDVYKNGAYVDHLTDITLASDMKAAAIGSDGGSTFMRGSIDDFRVYNTNLNATEILALYEEQVNIASEFTDNSKAIILAGGGDRLGNWLWEDTKRVTDFAYNALLWQGYTKENIYYLRDYNPAFDDADNDGFDDDDVDNNRLDDDVDNLASPTLADLETAITTWATDADNLVIYLADHGGNQTFQVQYGVENQVLHASDLAGWLDSLQDVMPGRVIIIYEACYSGSFVDPLKDEALGSNRILITSSGAQEKSKFQEYGRLSFSYQFWAGVYEGAKLAEAFNHGDSMMTAQHAWYDTDANGLPNTPSDIFPDIVIGPGFLSANEQPIITDRSPSQAISNGNTASLWAKVNSGNDVIVWAMIVPPEYDPSAPDTSATELPIVQLNYSAALDRYQGTYNGFTDPGVYQVSFYAMDDKGGISVPRKTTVEKRAKQPYPWILFTPVLGAAAK